MTAAGLKPDAVAEAFVSACLTEVRALKPGNVHIYAGGHGMQVADFETSARAAAPHIANPKLAIGARVLRAVEATFAAVSCNTNLGIILLCAPLAAAAERPSPSGISLQTQLRNVLARLDDADTLNVFQAIATASPGGLGDDEKSDVRHAPPPDMTLLAAMELARHRDLIAAEYVTGFERVFYLCHNHFQPLIAKGWSAEDAIARVYLAELARTPDSHIARKYSPAVAERLRQRAAAFETRHFSAPHTRPGAPDAQRALLALDVELKAEGLNPGSLADIMAAILFVAALEQDAPAVAPVSPTL